MKILTQEKDFRGWSRFEVKGTEEEVSTFADLLRANNNSVSCMRYQNTTDIYELVILQKELQDIINELHNHPDYIGGMIFTRNELIDMNEDDKPIPSKEKIDVIMENWYNCVVDHTYNPLEAILED